MRYMAMSITVGVALMLLVSAFALAGTGATYPVTPGGAKNYRSAYAQYGGITVRSGGISFIARSYGPQSSGDNSQDTPERVVSNQSADTFGVATLFDNNQGRLSASQVSALQGQLLQSASSSGRPLNSNLNMRGGIVLAPQRGGVPQAGYSAAGGARSVVASGSNTQQAPSNAASNSPAQRSPTFLIAPFGGRH